MVLKSMCDFSSLDPRRFEEFTASILENEGYRDVRLAEFIGDKGVDVYAVHPMKNIPIFVECKNTKSVGRPVLQKLHSAVKTLKPRNKKAIGIIATSGRISKGAYEYVSEMRISDPEIEFLLVDGEQLEKICNKHKISVASGEIISKIQTAIIPKETAKEGAHQDLKSLFNAIKLTKYKPKLSKENVWVPFVLSNFQVNALRRNSAGYVVYNLDTKGDIFITFHNHSKVATDGAKQLIIDGPLEKSNLGRILDVDKSAAEINNLVLENIRKQVTIEYSYVGGNNRRYYKMFKPKDKEINYHLDLVHVMRKTFNINVKKHQYLCYYFLGKETFHGPHGFPICVDCDKVVSRTKPIYVCDTCGKLVCRGHRKKDYHDKTILCDSCSFKKNLFVKTVHFKNKSSLKRFERYWKRLPFYKKFWIDKPFIALVLFGIIALMGLAYYLITSPITIM